MFKGDYDSEASEQVACDTRSNRFGAIDPRLALDALIHQNGMTYSAVSKLLGRNAAYVQQFIKRGTPQKLDERDRAILAQRFNVTEAALGAPALEGKVTSPAVALPVMDFLNVSERSYQSDSAAGFDMMMFDRRWLNSLSSARTSQLVILLAFGNNMHPTISSGDVLLVDRSELSPSRSGIYVTRYASTYSISRIIVNPTIDSLDIAHDTKAYPVVTGLCRSEVDTWGKVLWVSRRFD